MAMMEIPSGGDLTPHPWDRFGKPPRPGHPYGVAEQLDLLIEPALAAARHLVDADYERLRAESHEEAADDFERLARPFLDRLPPKLAEAIQVDPDAFTTADDVLREAAKADQS